MHRRHGRSIGYGLIAGVVGLAAMELARLLTRPLVKERAPRPTDVFLTERSMSPLGPQHLRGEDATEALARHAYQRLLGDELAMPLLGLADKPTAYHPTQHLQALACHVGFGVATTETTRYLEHLR